MDLRQETGGTRLLTTEKTVKTVNWLADCDVHEGIGSILELMPYLAEQWHMYLNRDSRPRIPPKHPYGHPQGGTSLDAIHPDGTSDDQFPERVREVLFDGMGVTHAMLMGTFPNSLSGMPQGKFAAGIASAYNDWLIEKWLSFDSRFKGSVAVAAQEPELAAEEIDRVGRHPSMVQVNLPISSPSLPWGDRRFYPIWEAAIRNKICVSFHVCPTTGLQGPPMAIGWPSTYMELRSVYSHHFEAGLCSLVCNGVFEKYPDLRVLLLEGGFAWIPSVMWRLDQSWRALRREVPWLTRRPSEYIRDHVRFGTQPFEEPDRPEHLLQIIDMLGSDELLVFSTDYPHWDYDNPTKVLAQLPAELRRKILWENARDFYRFPEPAMGPEPADGR
jgi:predicted TIM-barrel fold metal-dependent hydrolase